MYDMASDEEVGRQILSIFMQHKVGANGVLPRNNFIVVRDADFQQGLNKAVENRWIKTKFRDRYTYELTAAGLAAGLNAGLPPKPLAHLPLIGSSSPRLQLHPLLQLPPPHA